MRNQLEQTTQSDQELFEQYVRYRVNLMPNSEVETLDIDDVKAAPVVFLTPVGTNNLRGQDEFGIVKEQLGGDNYRPKNGQSFFSFTNTYGGHWSLVEYRFEHNRWSKNNISCQGDGACGVHAMVNAVLNNDNLKKNPLIIAAAKKAKLNLSKSKSLDMTQAVNFVINIIGRGNEEKEKIVRKLENLLRDSNDQNYWADTRDVEVFAQALGVLHCTHHKILNPASKRRELKDHTVRIAANIRGENNSRIADYRAQELIDIYNFTKGNSFLAERIDRYARGVSSVQDLQTNTDTEEGQIQKAIAESLKTYQQEQQKNSFVENENNDSDLRLAVARSLSELAEQEKDKNDPNLQAALKASIESAKREQQLRNAVAKKTLPEAFKEINRQKTEAKKPPVRVGKKVHFGQDERIPKNPIRPTRRNTKAVSAELTPEPETDIKITEEQQQKVCKKIHDWIDGDEPEDSFVSKVDPIISNLKSNLKKQAKNPHPYGAYNGIGADTLAVELDGKCVLQVIETFAPYTARFYIGDNPSDVNIAEWLVGKYITAVYIEGEIVTIDQLVNEENAQEKITQIFHDASCDIEFVVQDLDGNEKTIGCQRSEKMFFVTEYCESAKEKLNGRRGDICYPDEYGLEPFGGAKLLQQPSKVRQSTQ
ncbi:MAG: hypothetical protein V4612_06395 [Pseudomonadota bacterium]